MAPMAGLSAKFSMKTGVRRWQGYADTGQFLSSPAGRYSG
jgi:hypothetical protein